MNLHNAADAHVQQMMKWHFSSDTGSEFWLTRKHRLGFDPIQEIRGVDDLLNFPNLIDECRDVPIEQLIPKGLGPNDKIHSVYESGGTTGAPKRFVMFHGWFDQYMDWENSHYADDPPGNALALAPSGPHMFGDYSKRIAEQRGGVKFSIDLDPRWVKQLINDGDDAGARAYVSHLVDQAALVLQSQDITYLITTPPLLVSLLERRGMSEIIAERVRTVIWSGAHMDLDTLDYLQQELLPGVQFRGSYGSTTVLSGTVQRPSESTGDIVFDSHSPYVIYRVVDPTTGRPVEYGQEGAVVMNFVTKFGLVPNSLERDIATRVPSLDGVGDSLQNIHPVAEMNGRRLVEGVY